MRSNATVGQHQDQKLQIRKATHQIIEQLEGRRLLASSPYDFKGTPTFVPTTSDVGNIKNGPLAKGGQSLVDIFNAYQSFVKKGFNRYSFSNRSAYANDYNIRGRDLLVTLRTRGSVDNLVNDLKSTGSTIVTKSKRSHVIEAFVPINQLEALSSRRELMHLRPQLRAGNLSEGAVGNDAERSEKTQFVLPAFGVDGTGETVGVISDSFGSAASSGADLPSVNVLEDQIGTDEGRAMLELIHDLAPGAGLQFNTYGVSQSTFASAVRNLREAGSDVIVDDIFFETEPFFGEGVIDRAINDVHDDGATYFTANGNSGFAGYSKAVNWVDEPDSANGELAADFDGSDSGTDTNLDVHFNHAGVLDFQWDNAYDGVVGNVTSDVDIYLYRDGTLISAGLDNNFATGVPVERMVVPEGGDYEIVLRLNSTSKGATAPTMFKFVSTDNDMFDSRKDIEYGAYHNATFGHPGADGAIPVGAVDNAASNAFGTVRDLSSQDFSSAGPQVRAFDANGNRLAEPEVRLTPLVSGIQGTNTTIAPSFQPFFGTSAAAPNVAAIAALLLQIKPTATPDDVRDALVESAKSNPLNGAKSGAWDSQAGYGLVDAVKAASVFDPTTPVSTFHVSSINNTGSVSSLSVTFSEPVTGVDLSDFTLTRDGTSVNRFTGSEDLVADPDGLTYTITNLKSATSTLGVYTITLRDNRTNIVDVDNKSAAGNVVSFDVSLAKVGGLLADTLDDGKVRLRWKGVAGSSGYRIQRATDAAFSENIRNIDVATGLTTYLDNDVQPGEQYFYRVRAVKGGRLGDIARVSVVASSAGEVFVDDAQAKLVGNWVRYDDADAFMQSKTRAGGTGSDGRDANTALFSSSDIATGSYFVYARYTSTSKSATNATYQILNNKSVIGSVKIDQTKRGGGWVLLGRFDSTGAGGLSVRLNSAAANGSVTADAVRFLPADQETIAAFATQKAKKKTT